MSGIVKIRVELGDGTAYEREESIHVGSPRFHAREFQVAAVRAIARVRAAIVATYGDIDEETPDA